MKKSRHKGKRHHARYSILFVVVVLVAVYCVLDLTRPLPPIRATLGPSLAQSQQALDAAWPDDEESAVGVLGYGLIASHSTQKKAPTASIAKIVTSLAVLQRHPLELGQQGPTITLTQADVNDYNTFVAEDGSVVKVAAGEQLSEYQALQAMLLPSANNMADTLANWAFGSIPNYIKYANTMVSGLGMKNTVISDASGFSPQTVSTADDLILLGQAALENPVIAQIVDQKSANLPVAGVVNNVDYALGQDGLVGIKTGNTDQAGGCFLGAAKYTTTSGQTMTIISATMNAPTVLAALNDTLPLMNSVFKQVQLKTLNAGYAVASYVSPWGSTASAVTTTNIDAAYVPGMTLTYHVNSAPIKPPKSIGSVVGQTVYGIGQGSSTNIILSQSISPPSTIWRLFHPKYMFR